MREETGPGLEEASRAATSLQDAERQPRYSGAAEDCALHRKARSRLAAASEFSAPSASASTQREDSDESQRGTAVYRIRHGHRGCNETCTRGLTGSKQIKRKSTTKYPLEPYVPVGYFRGGGIARTFSPPEKRSRAEKEALKKAGGCKVAPPTEPDRS